MSPDIPDRGFFYIETDRLVARFPRVHPDAETDLVLQRTLRVPDDGKSYPLPTGLGHLPLRHLEDFERSLPRRWRDRGGVVTPMWPGEAMWIAFDVRYPCAVKIGTGKINALTRGQAFVSVEDIRAVAMPALRHRVLLNFEGEAEQVNPDTIVGELLAGLPPEA